MKEIKQGDWRLVRMDTGEQVCVGDKYEDFTIKGGVPPHKPSSTGRVWVEEYSREYFPQVCKMRWVQGVKTSEPTEEIIR